MLLNADVCATTKMAEGINAFVGETLKLGNERASIQKKHEAKFAELRRENELRLSAETQRRRDETTVNRTTASPSGARGGVARAAAWSSSPAALGRLIKR